MSIRAFRVNQHYSHHDKLPAGKPAKLLRDEKIDDVWKNQETGFMYGKEGRIIPIIVENVEIERFGFLEALQGIQIKGDNVEKCVRKILGNICVFQA